MHLKLLLLNRMCANALKRTYYTVGSRDPLKKNSVARQIQAKIKATGPITVADYMKEVLVNPLGGYYMHKNTLGAEGDFITSPELSQVFGELIAVWFLNEWSKAGSPKPIQIVELGPGRGTLCNDILRVFQHFRILEHSTIHLVEASPLMGDSQSKLLCKESHAVSDKNDVRYREGVSHNDVPISWYSHLKDVPHGFTLLVANEFFDALPVHKFVKTDRGYRELLVDLDPKDDQVFRFVTSPSETPVLKLFLRNGEWREQFEASPQTLMMAKEIATRVEFDGGLALIADYGHEGEGTDTFRAFRKHQLHDPLIEPGTADITADVDFQALKEVYIWIWCLEKYTVAF